MIRMIRIIRIGRPTHFRVKGSPAILTACGLVGSAGRAAAWDPRDVDCLTCRRTRAWKTVTGTVGKTRTP